MDPEITRNQNYDDHYANDGKYVHSAILRLHDDGAAALARPLYLPNSVIPS
jgi:hypothetical protein